MATIFISFADRDRKVAERLLSFLENHGLSCFFAPRNIQPGHGWQQSLSAEIELCSLMVLVLSSNTGQSQHVLREVDLAVDQHKPVLPIRVDKSKATGGLDYLLRPFQLLQASKSLRESELKLLLDSVKQLLDRVRVAVLDTSPGPDQRSDSAALIYRDLLLATSEHQLSTLTERVQILLEESPQDIEIRMLKRQVLKVEATFRGSDFHTSPAPLPTPRSFRPNAAVSLGFVAVFGAGAVLYGWEYGERGEPAPATQGAPVAAAPAPPAPVVVAPSTQVEPSDPKPMAQAEDERREQLARMAELTKERAGKLELSKGPVPASSPHPIVRKQLENATKGAQDEGSKTAREACGNRKFIALAVCMERECERAQFRSHEECKQVLDAKRKQRDGRPHP